MNSKLITELSNQKLSLRIFMKVADSETSLRESLENIIFSEDDLVEKYVKDNQLDADDIDLYRDLQHDIIRDLICEYLETKKGKPI